MPELPEVETVRGWLEHTLLGRRIVDVIVRRQQLREALPIAFAKRLKNEVIINIARRAKYLLVELSSMTWIIHLGMTARFRLSSSTFCADKHDHLAFLLDNQHYLIFTDIRRFGRMTLIEKEKTHPWLESLGVEPLSSEFTADYLKQATKRKTAPIKSVLMNSKVVVGIGNIYASESLFLAKINPKTVAKTITIERYERLVRAIDQTLKQAIDAGGSTLRNFVNGNGNSGLFQCQWSVYQKDKQPCSRCQHLIVRCYQSGRATFYCPYCQRW